MLISSVQQVRLVGGFSLISRGIHVQGTSPELPVPVPARHNQA